MELRNLSFVPGLFKIVDEIIVNAADNKQVGILCVGLLLLDTTSEADLRNILARRFNGYAESDCG